VPAAGRGTRLGGATPKALAPVGGKPMIQHVLERHRGHVALAVPVVRPGMEPAIEAVAREAGVPVRIVVQERPTGMLDAILLAAAEVRRAGSASIWITWCDQLAIRSETLAMLEEACPATEDVALAFPTVVGTHPYIHFERDGDGRIVALRQRREGDAMPAVGESDAGLFALTRHTYLDRLAAFEASFRERGATGERNFLPFIPWLEARHRGAVRTFSCLEPIEALGINTPDDLARIEADLGGPPTTLPDGRRR
jgi:bifunctional UDP-N-acetylglucosamine pyrophosphorylase/glucosamine-1-phosphate N-acetyltransferase